MERAVYYSKSFIIALAMANGKLNAEQAAQAAHVEVQSQIQRWGEVEDSECGFRSNRLPYYRFLPISAFSKI